MHGDTKSNKVQLGVWQSWGDKASNDEIQPVLQLRLSRLPFLSLHSLLPTEDHHSK